MNQPASPNAPQRVLQPAFRLQSVSAQRGAVAAVQNVSLEIPAGRWSAIVGPNGAGKSTLLRVMAALQPYRGEVFLQGQPLASYRPRALAQQMAWLGQNETTANDLRADDVVMLGRMPHQGWLATASAQDWQAVEQAMRTTQTWALRQRTLGELSGGERQRVLLARVLAVQAPVLLLDEPLANLDPHHQTQWLLDMQALVREGLTVITVLHEISIALHADELLVMQQGRVTHQGSSGDSATHRALEKAFQHRIQIHALHGQWAVVPRVGR